MLVKQRVKKLLSSLIIISALSLSGCGAKITQTNTTMTIESGDKLNFQPTDYFTSSKPDAFDEFVIDTTDVDTTTPGIYNIVVAYKKDRYSISVNVTETIQCINESFTTEAGKKLEVQTTDIFSAPDASMYDLIHLDTSSVDTNIVGTYMVNAEYKDRTYPITISVQDTTAPVLTIKPLGTYNVNDVVKIESVADVRDFSDYTVSFLLDNVKTSEITLSKGTTDYQVVAEDIYGNQSTRIATLSAYQTPEDTLKKIAEAEKAALEMLEQWAQSQNGGGSGNNSGNNNQNQGQSSNNGGGQSSSNNQSQGGNSNNNGQTDQQTQDAFNAAGQGHDTSIDLDNVEQGDSIGKGTIGG